jgi:hypothetical protein
MDYKSYAKIIIHNEQKSSTTTNDVQHKKNKMIKIDERSKIKIQIRSCSR